MKKFRISLVFVLLLLSLVLTACGTVAPSTWPGIAAVKDTAYVASGNGVFAINLKNGTMLWRFPDKAVNGKNFYAPPVISDDGQILVTDMSNTIYSVDSNGKQTWLYDKAKSGYLASPLATKDGIYAPSTDDNLYALTLQGTLRWTFSAKQALWASPVADGTAVYQPSMDHNLYALRPSDGTVIWSADLGGALVSTPALGTDGVMYAGTLAKEIIALKTSSGQILWRTPTADGVWGKLVLQNGSLVFGDASGKIYSINASNGKINWSKVPNPSGVILGGAAVLPDGFVLTTETGNVIYIDPSGTIKWNKPISGKLYATPIYASDQLLVAPMEGASLLESWDKDGKQNWAPFVAPK